MGMMCHHKTVITVAKITITKIITTENLKYYENYQKVTEIQSEKTHLEK